MAGSYALRARFVDHPMPQSLHQAHGHIVFSTKNRERLIAGEIETELHAYLGGIVRDLGGTPIAINGIADHVHILIRASKSVADTDFIRQVKGGSSKWMTDQGFGHFKWQAGYGWFGVSAKDLSNARDYVERQKEHHRNETFKEEFRRFLVRYGVDFDERYVWD